ncbi:GATA zinc finger domain-containing protein 1-like [Cryptotermes secundus]|uniref:GATA zinc finger domain-containing protein 1-like n=1 Tax=Cryptotermes secundus TaxID=105785 RepID=UPI000CD7BB76|nr:GATA zinc finger domain-containing protein 1-like [Cryptotermes secundus]
MYRPHKSVVSSTDIQTQFPPMSERIDSRVDSYSKGPEEDIPRKLECVEFVMHAPSDYFKARNTPFPPTHVDGSESNFIWTRLAPQMRST